jgi:hypothetical protein
MSSSVDQPTTMETTGTSSNQSSMGQQQTTTGSGGDFLDKGVSYAEKQAGYQGVRTMLLCLDTLESNDDVQSASTTEKISDGLRAGYEKVTGEHRSPPSLELFADGYV